jgi:glycosyltransferase involved in cell wall biosynthesis
MKFENIRLRSFEEAIPAQTINTCVIVPVKNEADHLVTMLNSLLVQVDENGHRLAYESYEILMLINNSDDESLCIARAFKLKHPSLNLHIESIKLPVELAHIGTVRKLLMDEAYRRFQVLGNNRGIIASIDGDTSADIRWLFQIRKEIHCGNDAVGGLIVISETAGAAENAYLMDMNYRYLLTEVEQLLCPESNDPLPRHFQFFGANMAVTAEYYQKSGGIPLVNCLEDMAFHQALIRCDARIRRSLAAKVLTSARFNGRVIIGFSEQLKKWSDETQEKIPQIVESTRSFIYTCYLKGQLKAHWSKKNNLSDYLSIEQLATALGVTTGWLKYHLLSHVFFGACWEEIWAISPLKQDIDHQYEPIQHAISNLKNFVKNPDVTSFQTNQAGSHRYVGAINAPNAFPNQTAP